MTTRRSTGKMQMARAVWFARPGVVELRPEQVAPPQPDEARVRMLYSGISRGTERLVLSGAVGPSEWERMRAPLQVGNFPFPVKYGYCAVGMVEIGPAALQGRTVFCLHPHQDVFNAPIAMLVPVPDAVPARRATLAANVETALNALWDAGAGPADRIVVVGAGVVGLCVAALCCRLPGADVTVIDIDEARRTIVESFGGSFVATSDTTVAGGHPAVEPGSPSGEQPATPKEPFDADVVFHTSATQAGLNTAIACAGMEATIVELSWYGEKTVTVALGGAFHSRRLKLISSQVGQVSPSRRARWTYRRRIEAALTLLDDARFDALVAEDIAFTDAVEEFPRLLGPGAGGLAPVVKY